MTHFQRLGIQDEWIVTDNSITDESIKAMFPGAFAVRIEPNVEVVIGGETLTGRLVIVTG